MSYEMTEYDNQAVLVKAYDTHYKNHLEDYNWSITELKQFSAFKQAFYSTITYNPIPLKPMSSTTAAFLGTKIGGAAVGTASAMNALKKEEQYKRDMEKYRQNELDNAYNKIDARNLYTKVMELVRSNPEALKKYKETEKQYIEHKEYVAIYGEPKPAPKKIELSPEAKEKWSKIKKRVITISVIILVVFLIYSVTIWWIKRSKLHTVNSFLPGKTYTMGSREITFIDSENCEYMGDTYSWEAYVWHTSKFKYDVKIRVDVYTYDISFTAEIKGDRVEKLQAYSKVYNGECVLKNE